MSGLYKILYIFLFFIVLISLGFALFYLSSNKKDSHRMISALTLRVILSFILLGLLLISFFSGLIQPNIS
jgi:phosphoglycerol transferase MdoB-like AlkP superfamily enzyme